MIGLGPRRERGKKLATEERSSRRFTKRALKGVPENVNKLFWDHRPKEMNQPDLPFFLAVITRQSSREQRNTVHEGTTRKNQIGKILSAAADNAGIQRIGSKVSNHYVRKTSISRHIKAYQGVCEHLPM